MGWMCILNWILVRNAVSCMCQIAKQRNLDFVDGNDSHQVGVFVHNKAVLVHSDVHLILPPASCLTTNLDAMLMMR